MRKLYHLDRLLDLSSEKKTQDLNGFQMAYVCFANILIYTSRSKMVYFMFQGFWSKDGEVLS